MKKVKVTSEMVIAVPLVIFWAILGIVCFFWDLEAGEMHFGHTATHLLFYFTTIAGIILAFGVLWEKAEGIADYFNRDST